MKTLLQILQQKVDDDIFGDIFSDNNEIVKAVKEYLEQFAPKDLKEIMENLK